MSRRVVVRSSSDNHILFSMFKAYYPHDVGKQALQEHKHAEIEISAITSGSGVYRCDEKDYEFSSGDVFFHGGNSVHCFNEIYPGDPASLLVIRFDPRFIWAPGGEWTSTEFLKLIASKNPVSRHISGDSETAKTVLELLNEMFEECRKQNYAYDIIVKAELMTILANMVRFFASELIDSESFSISRRHLDQMEKSTNYILSHLDSPLTLEELAREACMSRSYYSTMFKTLNGISVWDYITMQRVDLAQYQLENTEASVTQISENCGFTSISNFNRTFKKITGKSPREFRNHTREKSGSERDKK